MGTSRTVIFYAKYVVVGSMTCVSCTRLVILVQDYYVLLKYYREDVQQQKREKILIGLKYLNLKVICENWNKCAQNNLNKLK